MAKSLYLQLNLSPDFSSSACVFRPRARSPQIGLGGSTLPLFRHWDPRILGSGRYLSLIFKVFEVSHLVILNLFVCLIVNNELVILNLFVCLINNNECQHMSETGYDTNPQAARRPWSLSAPKPPQHPETP